MSEELEGKHGVQSLEVGMGILKAMVGGKRSMMLKDIAAAAGVSVGTFYRYFDDKRDVYLEVARRTMADAYLATIARLGPERFLGRGRRDTIAETVAILFDHVLIHPALTRSFQEMALRDPAVAALSSEIERVTVERLAALIAAICPRAQVPEPTATAWILHGAVMTAAYGLAGHRGPALVAAATARAALTDLIERALFP